MSERMAQVHELHLPPPLPDEKEVDAGLARYEMENQGPITREALKQHIIRQTTIAEEFNKTNKA